MVKDTVLHHIWLVYVCVWVKCVGVCNHIEGDWVWNALSVDVWIFDWVWNALSVDVWIYSTCSFFSYFDGHVDDNIDSGLMYSTTSSYIFTGYSAV